MRSVEEDPETLSAIVITHEHADHVNGVAVTARRLGIPVYFTEATHQAWMRWLTPQKKMSYAQWMEQARLQAAARKAAGPDEAAEGEPEAEAELPTEGVHPISPQMQELAEEEQSAEVAEVNAVRKDPTFLPTVEYFQPGQRFTIGDLTISPFTTPHDAADPVGFVLESEGVRMGYATDLGYMPPNVKEQLRGLDLLLLESNHDLEMLRDGPYPWSVKQRVLSRVGHLSNDAAAAFLEEDYDGQAAWVILAHLSESNNLPELARIAAEKALSRHPHLLGNRLLLAEQEQPLSSVYF